MSIFMDLQRAQGGMSSESNNPELAVLDPRVLNRASTDIAGNNRYLHNRGIFDFAIPASVYARTANVDLAKLEAEWANTNPQMVGVAA